jgi:3-deoxy-manno-octulosonate cytidylyltransferase (CMP-KDO synthetase)
MDPLALDAAVSKLQDGRADVSTLASPFAPQEDPANPNIVKVVLSRHGDALYFSRALIPFVREGGLAVAPFKHIGVYVYRVGFLRTYAALASTPLEQCEMLEQLRVLEHGYRIAAAVYPLHTTGIDTPEQYRAFVNRVAVSG